MKTIDMHLFFRGVCKQAQWKRDIHCRDTRTSLWTSIFTTVCICTLAPGICACPFCYPSSRLSAVLDKTYVLHIAFPLSSNLMSVWFLRTAISRPALVETVLLTGAGSLAASLNAAYVPTQRIQRTIHDTLQLRSRTLKSLRNLLHSSMCFSEESLMAIALLMCIEV